MSDAWRRRFPTASMLDVVDAVADLVADRVAERIDHRSQVTTPVERMAFSVSEAAAALGCGASTIRKAIKDGEIVAGGVAGRVLISRSELERLALGDDAPSKTPSGDPGQATP